MGDLKLAIYILLMVVIGYIFIQYFNAAMDIVVAIVGIIGSLVISVFKYSSDRLKEQENEILKIKRKNYQKLLEAIGRYALDIKYKHELVVIYTESWVFASTDVVMETNIFLNEPTQESLKKLLNTIRHDIGLSKLYNSDDLVRTLYHKDDYSSGFSERGRVYTR